MAVFSTDGEDEERLKTYILERVPPTLKSDLDAYILTRTATLLRLAAREAQFKASLQRRTVLQYFASLAISIACRGFLRAQTSPSACSAVQTWAISLRPTQR
eukprot:2342132-Prymnesium_polylepis.1